MTGDEAEAEARRLVEELPEAEVVAGRAAVYPVVVFGYDTSGAVVLELPVTDVRGETQQDGTMLVEAETAIVATTRDDVATLAVRSARHELQRVAWGERVLAGCPLRVHFVIAPDSDDDPA